ncbi:hypothetical protein ABZ234_08250 [Nocardiopsis sp. NPDC006198]|uniref:hypothetical protein n=1 Tax=Nocardiopsis sp. NPDC006198 TaxID=3154472 RepID=UPI0033A66711
MPPTRPVPLWLRFWPQAVLTFGLGLMFGSAFTGLWWPGLVITLVGAALIAAYFRASERPAPSTQTEERGPRP